MIFLLNQARLRLGNTEPFSTLDCEAKDRGTGRKQGRPGSLLRSEYGVKISDSDWPGDATISAKTLQVGLNTG